MMMKHQILFSGRKNLVKNRLLLLFFSMAVLAGCSKSGGDPIDPTPEPPVVEDDYKIHSIYELNQTSGSLDSHAGEEQYSVLEMDRSTLSIVSKDILGINDPQYARIKKTANGKYLLFYQNA